MDPWSPDSLTAARTSRPAARLVSQRRLFCLCVWPPSGRCTRCSLLMISTNQQPSKSPERCRSASGGNPHTLLSFLVPSGVSRVLWGGGAFSLCTSERSKRGERGEAGLTLSGGGCLVFLQGSGASARPASPCLLLFVSHQPSSFWTFWTFCIFWAFWNLLDLHHLVLVRMTCCLASNQPLAQSFFFFSFPISIPFASKMFPSSSSSSAFASSIVKLTKEQLEEPSVLPFEGRPFWILARADGQTTADRFQKQPVGRNRNSSRRKSNKSNCPPTTPPPHTA